MSQQEYGGIMARSWNPGARGWTCLAEGPYFLYRYSGAPGDCLALQHLPRFTAFLPDSDAIWQGDSFSGSFALEAPDVFFGGVKTAAHPGQAVLRSCTAHRVRKPWGEEQWLSGTHAGYCLKRILIRRGQRTSLQLHVRKRETNVLLSGKLRLHFQETASRSSTVDLNAPVSLEIPPGRVHRMEALTDLVFLEISTPEVDDVIRLEDDAGRPDGRIAAEHGC